MGLYHVARGLLLALRFLGKWLQKGTVRAALVLDTSAKSLTKVYYLHLSFRHFVCPLLKILGVQIDQTRSLIVVLLSSTQEVERLAIVRHSYLVCVPRRSWSSPVVDVGLVLAACQK